MGAPRGSCQVEEARWLHDVGAIMHLLRLAGTKLMGRVLGKVLYQTVCKLPRFLLCDHD